MADPVFSEQTAAARRPVKLGVILVATAIVAGLGGAGVMYAATRGDVAASCDVVGVAARAMPAVVTVMVQGAGGASGSGSGALVSADGTIVTNDHVIAPAASGGSISVVLSSGESKDAVLVGTDPKTDLAVLRVEGSGLPTVPIGTPAALAVGQQVVALGAPLGLSGTVTSGIVSALDRDIEAPVAGGGSTVLVGTVQTDASINPGNSGGPLVDCAGRLVGINTVIATVPDAGGTAGGGNVGIGFAVPADTVHRIAGELASTGRATHPWHGLTLRQIPPGMLVTDTTDGGLFVQAVAAGGPGERAGIHPGDVVLAISGTPATTFANGQLLATASVGDPVELTVLRNGARPRCG